MAEIRVPCDIDTTDPTKVVLTPEDILMKSTVYHVEVTKDVKSAAGQSLLEPFSSEFTTETVTYPEMTFQWQIKLMGVTWTSLMDYVETCWGTDTDTFTYNRNTAQIYRCLVTNATAITQHPVKLYRIPTTLGYMHVEASPGVAELVSDEAGEVMIYSYPDREVHAPASAYMETTTDPNCTYQWQRAVVGIETWYDIEGATLYNYATDPTVYPTIPSIRYRCKVTTPSGILYIDPIVVTVLEPI